jgi:hypothetical protein
VVLTVVSGHKNVASINEYSTASLNQKIQMSHILSDIGSGGGNSGNVCKERSSNDNGCLNNNKNVWHLYFLI